MISVAGDAFGRHFSCRAVAGDAVCFCRHEHIGRLAALRRAMTIVAFHARVFGVIESCLRHPAIDQNRFGNDRRRVRHWLHFVAESAAGEVRTRRRSHLPLRFVGIARKEHGPLQFLTRAKGLPQLPDLLRNEVRHISIACNSFFEPRVIGVLGWQGAQEGPGERDVAMRNFQVRIFRVELEQVTGLAVGSKGDPLIITAFGIWFVAVIAIEFFSVHPGNVGREMALMIEAQDVAMFLPIVIKIARFFALQLKFRMPIPKRGKRLRVTPRRSGQFQNDLCDRMRMAMEVLPLKLHSFLRGRFHGRGVVVAGSAVRARHRSHQSRPLVFLMANRARAVLNHVGLMECVQ